MDEMDFKLLKVLYKTQNITRAADILYITQSALSKRIAVIESEFGVSIILRTRQGIRFTSEGETILKHTCEAAKQLQLLREQLLTDQGYVSGTLNAGITNNYALFNLIGILTPYMRQYPHVVTNIITDHSRKLFTRLYNGSIDIAIVRGEYPWTEQKVLLKCENICAIRSMEDKDKSLQDIPYIGRITDSIMNREIERWLRENKLHTKAKSVYVDNIMTCVAMVTSGLGWAIVPEIALSDFSGYSVPLVLKNGNPIVRSTYLLYSDSAAMLPQVKAFINVVMAVSSNGINHRTAE
jgi:DNA-binding transcriptional LysR family regulator